MGGGRGLSRRSEGEITPICNDGTTVEESHEGFPTPARRDSCEGQELSKDIEKAKKIAADVFTEEQNPLAVKQVAPVQANAESIDSSQEVTPPSDTISRQTSLSEPASTTSIDTELTVPEFLTERKKEARKKLEDKLLSETLPRIKKTKRTEFGGSRKRTLKKRRGVNKCPTTLLLQRQYRLHPFALSPRGLSPCL
jgi:hypothetical protein